MIRTVLKILLPVLLLAAGVGFAVRMVKTKPKAKHADVQAPTLVVDVIEAAQTAEAVVIEAQGTVLPDRTVTLSPQVTGLVKRVAPELEPGGRVRGGDVLVRLDDRDLRIGLSQRRTDLVQARSALDQELGRAEVAQSEWEQLESGRAKASKLGAALALRKPQIDAAKAKIEAAESAIEKAQVDLGRVAVEAPFDAIVRERRVAEGQLVSPATPIAVLVATDRFFVQVTVPMEKLVWVDIPGLRGVAADSGSTVRVLQQGAAKGHARTGRVVRLLGDLDPAGRMARLLVAVDAPLDPVPGAPDALPLLLGAFVQVQIVGRTLDGVVRLPRMAIREGERVWLVDGQSRLAVTDIEIVWRQRDDVLVRTGVRAGDKVVISRIAGVEPGMRLTVRDRDGKAAPAPDAATATATTAEAAP